jgi:drug/metabolite transporter (DMT)-like permease
VRPALLAVILVALWGLNWPAAFIALGSVPPLTFRVLTLAVGGSTLMLFCLVNRISVRVRKRDFTRLISASFLNVVAWNILSVYAIVQLNSARSAIVAFSMPFWTTIIEWLLGESPTPSQRVAIAISSVGVAGLVLSASFDPTFNGIGAVVMSGAAFAWACGSVYVKRRPVDMPSAAFTAWALMLGAAMIALFLPLQHEGLFESSLDWQAVAACLYATFIGIALCQACWFSLLGTLGPVGSSLVLLGIPPVGVVSSWLLVGATVSTLDIASLVLLLLAAASSLPVMQIFIRRLTAAVKHLY